MFEFRIYYEYVILGFREKKEVRSTPISPEKSKTTTTVYNRSNSLPSDVNDTGNYSVIFCRFEIIFYRFIYINFESIVRKFLN